MSRVYPAFVDACIDACIDGDTGRGPIRAGLVGETFEYNDNDITLDDVPVTFIGDPVNVVVADVHDGVIYINPVTFSGVEPGENVRGVLFYMNDDDRLVCFIDRRADTIPIDIEPDGGDITFTFDRLLKL